MAEDEFDNHILHIEDSNEFPDILTGLDPEINVPIRQPECNILFAENLPQQTIEPNTFSCLSINIDGIKNKSEEFQLQLNLNNNFRPSVLGVCETKLTDIRASMHNIPGYQLITNNYMGNKGGVALYIREGITFIPKPQLTFIIPGIETVFADIIINGETKTVGMIYRRAMDITIPDFADEITSRILENLRNNKAYLMGDFNINLLRYRDSANIANFYHTMMSHGFRPMITKPTRVTPNTATLIDNIYTNDISNIVQSSVIITAVSDHYTIYTKYTTNDNPVNNNIQIINYRKFTDESLNNFKIAIEELNCDEIDSIDDACEAFNYLHNYLTDKFEICFPLKQKRITDRDIKKPWITGEILTAIKLKQRLSRKYTKYPLTYGADYRRQKNLVARTIKTARETYFQNILERDFGDSKKTWNTINKILGKTKPKNSNCIKIENIIIDNPKEIATKFNEYFNSIPTTLSNSIDNTNNATYDEFLINPLPQSQPFDATTNDEIKSVIEGMKDSNSTGIDCLTTKIIKLNVNALTPILKTLVNKSLSQGKFPEKLKTAKIIPVFKNKDKTEISNYRPISILPVISKIYERVFYNRLYNYFNFNNLFSESQYGFRSGRSTELALLKFSEDIIHSFNDGKNTVATFMDLSKAFDCVNHEILLKKLEHYGINRICIQWVQSYITNRQHYSSWNENNSPTCSLNIGVPQGSILGPLLFLIYINDIVNSSQALTFVLFADDTTVYTSHKYIDTAINSMNNELQRVAKWFDANKLSLNVSKTQTMLLSRKKKLTPSISVSIKDQEIARVAKTKFLGVVVDEHLTWKDHIALISNKISKSCGIIFQIRNSLTDSAKKLIYNSLIHPYITYCLNVYASTYPTNLKPLELSQKRAIRALSVVGRRDHTAPLFEHWRILPIKNQITYSSAIFAFKDINNLIDSNNFLTFNNNPQYNLRNNDNLRIPQTSNTHSQKFLKYRAVKDWNAISIDIKQSNTLANFKRKLKVHLMSAID